ncbi:hypothetical protein ABPG75_008822 [Micractinium tetrahymenae]
MDIMRIFGCLELKERLRSLPRVCRRFAELCSAPQLLPGDVRVRMMPSGELERMRSLAEWLVRRGAGAVRRLQLHLTLCMRDSDADGLNIFPSTDDADQLEVLAEALQAVAFCAARGSLQDLDLELEFLPAFRLSAATAAALSALRRLQLRVVGSVPGSEDGMLAVVGPLHTMTALQELSLHGEPLVFKPALRFPPALTKLSLSSEDEDPTGGVPQQLSGLRQLRVLSLNAMARTPMQLSVLTHLTALERLSLSWCALPGPDTLAALPSLAALELDFCPPAGDNVGEAVGPALAALQGQLTELQVHCGVTPPIHAPPQQLGGCSRLRHLAWLAGSAGPEAAPLPLPPGAWLGRLRRLVLHAAVVSASLGLLQSAASQLEQLGVCGLNNNAPDLLEVVAFAGSHPRLARLAVDTQEPSADVREAAAAAQQQKPTLDIVWTPSDAWAAAVALGGDAVPAHMRQVLAGIV